MSTPFLLASIAVGQTSGTIDLTALSGGSHAYGGDLVGYNESGWCYGNHSYHSKFDGDNPLWTLGPGASGSGNGQPPVSPIFSWSDAVDYASPGAWDTSSRPLFQSADCSGTSGQVWAMSCLTNRNLQELHIYGSANTGGGTILQIVLTHPESGVAPVTVTVPTATLWHLTARWRGSRDGLANLAISGNKVSGPGSYFNPVAWYKKPSIVPNRSRAS